MNNRYLKSQTIGGKANNPTWAIVIPSYYRLERFFVCLRCLLYSITYAKVDAQVIIMDNAHNSHLLARLTRYLEGKQYPITLTYVQYPQVNQSTLRNTALTFMCPSIQYIFFLDSDIYISSETVGTLNQFFEKHPHIIATAPPLAPYRGGRHGEARKLTNDTVSSTGQGLIMPSEYEYKVGKKRGTFLQTLMLRGAFAIRRKELLEIFGSRPWLPIFELWQNVPFYLTLIEYGKEFGYVLDGSIIALHDERQHKDTIASHMPDWHSQTIKSIVLLFFRNQLWLPEQQRLNARFISAMEPIIDRHVHSFDGATSLMFTIAYQLSLPEVEGKKGLIRISKRCKQSTIKETISLLLKELWTDFALVNSHNLNQPM